MQARFLEREQLSMEARYGSQGEVIQSPPICWCPRRRHSKVPLHSGCCGSLYTTAPVQQLQGKWQGAREPWLPQLTAS